MNLRQWHPFKYPQHQNKAQTPLLSGGMLRKVLSYYCPVPLTPTPNGDCCYPVRSCAEKTQKGKVTCPWQVSKVKNTDVLTPPELAILHFVILLVLLQPVPEHSNYDGILHWAPIVRIRGCQTIVAGLTRLPPVLLNKVLLEHSQAHLFMAELSSCDRDHFGSYA